jgi:Protein of unknown function (DUF2891)
LGTRGPREAEGLATEARFIAHPSLALPHARELSDPRLPDGDPRIAPALAAARRHADAALPHVAGDDYMVEHWLACYAVLLLS